MKNNKWLRALLAAVLALVLIFGETAQLFPAIRNEAAAETQLLARSRKKNKATATPMPAVTETPAVEADPGLPTATPLPEGPITDPQSIADYIFANGCLPDNFITKRQAQDLGWDSSYNYVGDVAPGKSIGGDRFGNYEGLLPTAKGRQYYECDCYYTGRKRNAYRIIFSNDGLVYYTGTHYESFVEMHPTTWNLEHGVTDPLGDQPHL